MAAPSPSPSPFCTSTSTSSTSSSPLLLPWRTPRLRSHKPHPFPCVSLQESLPPAAQQPPPVKPSFKPSKNSVWINPASKRAAKLHASTGAARQARLKSIAAAIDAASSSGAGVVAASLGAEFPGGVSEKDAAAVLNYVANADAVVPALHWFLDHVVDDGWVGDAPLLYNVALKVLRKCRDWERVESVWNDMVARGIKPDNVTFSTVISCARQCSLPSKAVEWFEKMTEFGCTPDDVTYAVMIDAYGQAGDVAMATGLYDRARREKRRIDPVTFATVIKTHCTSGNFDAALNVYEEMKAVGCKPNLVIYNTLLDTMGRAGRPWQVKTLHREMLSNELEPSAATFSALLRAYSKARYAEDAFAVYRQMKEGGMEPNLVLCNMLLSMCADLGLVSEAEELFMEMKASTSETGRPDSWSYSALITAYSCCGNVGEAEGMLREMLEVGFQPNLFVLTSVIQCYGNAGRTDDVVRSFDRLLELQITPDDRFCGCLLNVATRTPLDELWKVIKCIDRSNAKLGSLVKLLVEDTASNDEIRESAEAIFAKASDLVVKAYFNCLIDLCVNLNKMERACVLLDLALRLEVYGDIQSRTPTQWSLHLRGLSVGAALTTLHVWVKELSAIVQSGEVLPPLLGINTGHGKHKYSEKGLAVMFESHLKELNAPFHEAPDKAGWFLTTNVAAKKWIESRM